MVTMMMLMMMIRMMIRISAFFMIIFFAAIIVPIQDLCRPLCGRKSNVYQTSLLNICGDKILHRLNISEKIFHLLNYFWGQNFVLSCTSSGTKNSHDCGDGFWRSTKYEVQEVQIMAGQGHYILTRGKQRQGKIWSPCYYFLHNFCHQLPILFFWSFVNETHL